jgi:hypothetical protein
LPIILIAQELKQIERGIAVSVVTRTAQTLSSFQNRE